MFARPLRLALGPDANASDRDCERRAASAAIGGAEAFWLTLIAVLASLAVAPGAIPSLGSPVSHSGCLFAGRGGAICNGSALSAEKASENPGRCLSYGKGGRFCPLTK